MTFLESWINTASALLPQALAGEPAFVETAVVPIDPASVCITARVTGKLTGTLRVLLPPALLEAPLLGDENDALASWIELLREVAQGAAGDLLHSAGVKCSVDSVGQEKQLPGAVSRSFEVRAGQQVWVLQVSDDVREEPGVAAAEVRANPPASVQDCSELPAERPGIQLLVDVELEATLRFGCRELELGEILNLGPGEVVALDRQISDPVDLIVGDKVVAHGEVVLVNGNFGLRVTEVATPRQRLESIRCLF